MAVTELLTSKQVAEVFGKTVTTVNRWASTGRLRIAHKLPGETGAYLFARVDVDALKAEMDAA